MLLAHVTKDFSKAGSRYSNITKHHVSIPQLCLLQSQMTLCSSDLYPIGSATHEE